MLSVSCTRHLHKQSVFQPSAKAKTVSGTDPIRKKSLTHRCHPVCWAPGDRAGQQSWFYTRVHPKRDVFMLFSVTHLANEKSQSEKMCIMMYSAIDHTRRRKEKMLPTLQSPTLSNLLTFILESKCKLLPLIYLRGRVITTSHPGPLD